MKMKQFFSFVCFGLFILLPMLNIAAQEGFTGPGSNTNARGQGQLVTAVAAKTLPNDTRVLLQGNITQSLGKEKYVFQDNSGEITINIDRKVWRGLSVGENDRVEIYGEVDIERSGVKIEVKTVRKI